MCDPMKLTRLLLLLLLPLALIACVSGEECATGSCERGVCAVSSFCVAP